MNGVEPYACLDNLFTRLANRHLARDIDALMRCACGPEAEGSQGHRRKPVYLRGARARDKSMGLKSPLTNTFEPPSEALKLLIYAKA